MLYSNTNLVIFIFWILVKTCVPNPTVTIPRIVKITGSSEILEKTVSSESLESNSTQNVTSESDDINILTKLYAEVFQKTYVDLNNHPCSKSICDFLYNIHQKTLNNKFLIGTENHKVYYEYLKILENITKLLTFEDKNENFIIIIIKTFEVLTKEQKSKFLGKEKYKIINIYLSNLIDILPVVIKNPDGLTLIFTKYLYVCSAIKYLKRLYSLGDKIDNEYNSLKKNYKTIKDTKHTSINNVNRKILEVLYNQYKKYFKIVIDMKKNIKDNQEAFCKKNISSGNNQDCVFCNIIDIKLKLKYMNVCIGKESNITVKSVLKERYIAYKLFLKRTIEYYEFSIQNGDIAYIDYKLYNIYESILEHEEWIKNQKTKLRRFGIIKDEDN